MDMIVASHESASGNYKKLKNMFENNSSFISEKEKIEYIDIYCSDELKKVIEI